MEKGILIFSVSIVIIPTRLLGQMHVNSSGAEFWSTISKFMKKMNFVIACLRPSQNMKFSWVVVQLTAKKCTKKCDAREKLLFCLVKLLLLWLSRRRRIFNFLLFMIHCDESKTEYSRGKLNCSCWYHPKRFFDSSVVPSFLVRKVENKSFPCSHKLCERTGQVCKDNSRHVRSHEKNWGETVRRLGTIIQSFFVPNQEPASAWIFGNNSVRVGT